MSETTPGPKVPGRTTTEKAAETAKEAVDTTADKVETVEKGFRARVRAIRNDYDVESIEKDAKPFLTGAVIVGAAIVDPVLAATIGVNRVGRYIQRHHRQATDTKVSE